MQIEKLEISHLFIPRVKHFSLITALPSQEPAAFLSIANQNNDGSRPLCEASHSDWPMLRTCTKPSNVHATDTSSNFVNESDTYTQTPRLWSKTNRHNMRKLMVTPSSRDRKSWLAIYPDSPRTTLHRYTCQAQLPMFHDSLWRNPCSMKMRQCWYQSSATNVLSWTWCQSARGLPRRSG